MLEGEVIYDRVLKSIKALDKLHRVPSELHLTLDNHKVFLNWLEEHPEKRGDSKEFGSFSIGDIFIDIIPQVEILVTDDDGEVIKKLDIRLI